MKEKKWLFYLLLTSLGIYNEKLFAQNEIVTVLCNIAKTEVIYKERLIELELAPYYKIYKGPITASGYRVKKSEEKNEQLYLKNFSGFSFSEKFSDGFSPKLIEYVQNFGSENKININVRKSIYSNISIARNPAGMIIMGIDMSDFIKNKQGKTGIYVCDIVYKDNPEEIKEKLAKLEGMLESNIRFLPDIIKEKLVESNRYNKKTGELKYDIDIIKINGISKRLPNEDEPAYEYKKLFYEFNEQVLSLYSNNPEQVPAAATKFIDKYNFPAAYAIKARYLVSNNDFAAVKDQVFDLIKINRKLLGAKNINESNYLFRDKFYYGSVNLYYDDTYYFKYGLNEVFYHLAMDRYAENAIKAGITKTEGLSLYELRQKSLNYLSNSGIFNFYSTATNKPIKSDERGPVRMELKEDFKEFDYLFSVLFQYLHNNIIDIYSYKTKPKEFKNSLQLNALRYLVNRKFDLQDTYNRLGLYYDYLFKSKYCNADSATYYYQQAAALGSKYAMLNLARQYYFGTGIKQNINKTREWLSKAKASGNDISYDEGVIDSNLKEVLPAQNENGDKIIATFCNKQGIPIKGPIVLKAFNDKGLPDTLYYKVKFTKNTVGTAEVRPNLDNNSVYYTFWNKITTTGELETGISAIVPREVPTFFISYLEFYLYSVDNKKELVKVKLPFTVKWQ